MLLRLVYGISDDIIKFFQLLYVLKGVFAAGFFSTPGHILIYDAISKPSFAPFLHQMHIFNHSFLVRMSEILLVAILKVAGS